MADARLLWEWANDPVTRTVSFTSDAIPWETHWAWLKQKLADGRVHYFIAVAEHGDPVAQVRFEVEGERAVVSVSVAPGERRKGYGVEALRLGAAELRRATAVRAVDAYIKPGNSASEKAFHAAGYVRQPDCIVNGMPAIYMILESP